MHRSGNCSRAYTAEGRTRGFTLVELMVTVAIVAILMAIAVPSYSVFMRQSRRADTEATLVDIAQREQQYLLDQRAYAPDLVTLNVTLPADVSAYYTVNIGPVGAAPPTFVVTATPKAGTQQAGDFTLTINNTGARAPANAW